MVTRALCGMVGGQNNPDIPLDKAQQRIWKTQLHCRHKKSLYSKQTEERI